MKDSSIRLKCSYFKTMNNHQSSHHHHVDFMIYGFPELTLATMYRET